MTKLTAECVKEANGEIILSIWIRRHCAFSTTIDSTLGSEIDEEIGGKIKEAVNKYTSPDAA